VGADFFVYANNTGVTQVDALRVQYGAGTVTQTTNILPTPAGNSYYDAVRDPNGGVLFAWKTTGTNRMHVARSTNGTTLAVNTEIAAITNFRALSIRRYSDLSGAGATNPVGVAYGANTGGYLVTLDAALSAVTHGPTQVLTGDFTGLGLVQQNTDGYVHVVGLATTTNAMSTCELKSDHSFLGTQYNAPTHAPLSAPFGIPAATNDVLSGSQAQRTHVLVGSLTASSAASPIPHAMVAMLRSTISGAADFGGYTFFTPAGLFPASMVVTDAAAPTSTIFPLPNVPRGSGNTWYLPVLRLLQGTDYEVDLVALTVPLTNGIVPVTPRAPIAGGVFLAGGLPRLWTGGQLVEPTPLQPPSPPASVSEPAGSVPAGTYAFAMFWSWVDGRGNVWRGPVSTAFSHTIASGTQSMAFNVDTHFPSTTTTTGTDQRLRLEVYRTLAGGSTFYRDSIYSTTAGTDVAVNSNLTDGTLAGNDLLYTAGNVLQAEAPPALQTVILHQDRLWGLSAEDPTLLYYTKVREQGFGYEWNATLVERLPAPGVALASMDDKLLVLSETDCWALRGDGPSATGAGGFAPLEPIARGLGANGANSVVVTPIGALVHSPSGFKLLGRDLSVTDVGVVLDTAPGSTPALASHHFVDKQQAWFLVNTSTIVAFEYERGRLRWHVVSFTTNVTSIVDIDEFQRAPAVLIKDAVNGHEVWLEDSTSHQDVNRFVPFKVQTGWYRPEGEGLTDARFRVLHLYGRNTAPAGVKVTVELQGEQRSAVSDVEVRTFHVGEQSGTVPAHFRMRLKRQRGFAARVTIEQDGTGLDNVNVEGFVPFGIEWEFGTRSKSTKVGATASKA
jgi:hypothetical protein